MILLILGSIPIILGWLALWKGWGTTDLNQREINKEFALASAVVTGVIVCLFLVIAGVSQLMVPR